MEQFTVITPTGDRPDAFALCWKYIMRQTLLPFEWIIIDDGISDPSLPDYPPPWIRSYKRERNPKDPKHTLPVQLLAALDLVCTDKVLIVEDDDWYRKDYCERMMGMFQSHPQAQLIGQGQAVYYHVAERKHFQLVNSDRASLCQTGFRSSLIPQVRKACEDAAAANDPFVDLRLWKNGEIRDKFLLMDQSPMCVGIKGMPGRSGMQTIGHNAKYLRFKPDPDISKLKMLVGKDAELYLRFQDPSRCTLPAEKSILEGPRPLKSQAIGRPKGGR